MNFSSDTTSSAIFSGGRHSISCNVSSYRVLNGCKHFIKLIVEAGTFRKKGPY